MPRPIAFRTDPDGNREGRGRFGYYVVIGSSERWLSRYVNESGPVSAATVSAHCGSEGMAMAWCDAHERSLGAPAVPPVTAPITIRPPRPQLALLPSPRPDRPGRV